jgi:23S rRNA (guanosine2251-2'-O)-methyltransferase
VYLVADFSDERLLALISAVKPSIKTLHLKNPPRGVSSLAPHQGIVAGISAERLQVPYRTYIETVSVTNSTAVLVLAEVQDPHNVGAVIRSAAAFGMSAVLIPEHNQAPVTGTVVKVSAGMAFKIPLVAIGNVNTTLRDLKQRGFFIYGLEGAGTATTHSEQYTKPSVFVLGNEGEGLREKTAAVCDALLSIPIHPRCESLNAAAATAVVLADWSAQHRDALRPA